MVDAKAPQRTRGQGTRGAAATHNPRRTLAPKRPVTHEADKHDRHPVPVVAGLELVATTLPPPPAQERVHPQQHQPVGARPQHARHHRQRRLGGELAQQRLQQRRDLGHFFSRRLLGGDGGRELAPLGSCSSGSYSSGSYASGSYSFAACFCFLLCDDSGMSVGVFTTTS